MIDQFQKKRAILVEHPRSIVIPVYANEANIANLLSALMDLSSQIPGELEIVFVVDGSPDRSYVLLWEALPEMPFASQLVALSRNFGSFAAIRCGLELARGEHIAVMAADLQEPPELLIQFFAILEEGQADIVFGRRSGRRDSFVYAFFSNVFWTLYRRLVLADVPRGGVDVFACNRLVSNEVLRIREPNSSLISQLFWVGFRRKFVSYQRRKREFGTSAWHFRKRLRYMLDSVFSFTDLPIVFLLWVGGGGLFLSLFGAIVVLVAWSIGAVTVPGYTPLMLAVLLIGFLVLMTQGILGSYLWRAFENTKQRPLTILQHHHIFECRKINLS